MLILKPTLRKRTIGIVTPSRNPVYRTVQKGILQQLSLHEDLSYQFMVIEKTNDVPGLKVRLDSMMDRHSFDALFALGNNAANVCKGVTIEKEDTTPIVFGGITQKTANEIVHDSNRRIQNITGTWAKERDYVEQMLMLCTFLKNTERSSTKIVIPFHPEGLAESKSDVEMAVRAIRAQNANVSLLEIENFDSFEEQIKSHITPSTVILLLRDRIAVDNLDKIIAFSNMRNVPVCTSDLESINFGATIGIGDSDKNIGVEMAKLALPILFSQLKPSEISMSKTPWKNKLVLNKLVKGYPLLHVNESLRYFSDHEQIELRN